MEASEARIGNETITKPKLLLVEGPSDGHVCTALLNLLEVHDVQVLEHGGKSAWKKWISGLTLDKGFHSVTAIGLMRDADNDPRAEFQSVCSSLASCGLPVPSEVLMRTTSRPAVVVSILPSDSQPGCLDDVLVASVACCSAMKCVDKLFECLEEKSVPPPGHMAKARAHAYLATCANPELTVGVAAHRGYWNLESDALLPVKRLIELL